MIETSWLRALASFAVDANLSRAARRLHLTQPAVHAQLRKLGEALGAPLYARRGRGLVLTREGTEAVAFARDFEEQARALVSRVRGVEETRPLVCAAGAGAILYVAGEGLRAFTRRAEGPLEIVTADAPATIEAVASGAAHVGIAVLDATPAGLHAHRLTEIEQVVVLPRAHPLARRKRLSARDLEGERLVLPPAGRPQRAAIEPTVAAIARGWELAIKFAELGVGLAVVNACCTIPRSLVARPLRGLPKIRYAALTRPRPRADAAELVRALVQHGEAWRTR
jgi:DNA-binding transcriptional LysR family regulator